MGDDRNSSAPPMVLDWYRLDQTRPIAAAMLTGLVLIVPGSVLVALHLAWPNLDPAWRLVMGCVGLTLTIGGPLHTLLRLRRCMRLDSCLAMRTDGLSLHRDDELERFLPWDSIADMRYEPVCDQVVIQLEDGSELRIGERFAGISPIDLAKRLHQARRLTRWGYL